MATSLEPNLLAILGLVYLGSPNSNTHLSMWLLAGEVSAGHYHMPPLNNSQSEAHNS